MERGIFDSDSDSVSFLSSFPTSSARLYARARGEATIMRTMHVYTTRMYAARFPGCSSVWTPWAPGSLQSFLLGQVRHNSTRLLFLSSIRFMRAGWVGACRMF